MKLVGALGLGLAGDRMEDQTVSTFFPNQILTSREGLSTYVHRFPHMAHNERKQLTRLE